MALKTAARYRLSGIALPLMALVVVLPFPTTAQEVGRASLFLPTIDTTFTYVDLQRFDTAPSRSELVSELRPGFQYSSRSGRLQGAVSYGLGLVHRSRTDPSFEAQNRLSAALTGELIENFAFLDVSANVGQQFLSPFGQQSGGTLPTENANRQESGTLSISPSLRGSLAGVAVYDLRLTASGTNTRKSVAGDSTSTGGSFSLNSANRRALFGWGLNASSTTTDFRASGKSSNDRVAAQLDFNPDVELGLGLRAGRESTDIGTNGRQAYDTWGASLRWAPSPRTVADFNTDRRFFGRAHRVTLSHRLALSSLRFSSVRDVALSANPNSLGQPLTVYDLFFEQFASQEPDPLRRQQLVLNFLAGLGLDPTAALGGGSINRGPTVQERNDLGLTYAARRLTLSAQAFVNRTRQLENVLPASGADARQRGYTASASYRLTPTASLSALGSRLMTKSTVTQPGTDLKSLGLTFSDRIGPYATAALNARYTVFNSAFTPYRETAVGASLGLRF